MTAQEHDRCNVQRGEVCKNTRMLSRRIRNTRRMWASCL